MEQTKVEAALKKVWKEYKELKMRLAAMEGNWSAREEIKLDAINEIGAIVEYIEKEIVER